MSENQDWDKFGMSERKELPKPKSGFDWDREIINTEREIAEETTRRMRERHESERRQWEKRLSAKDAEMAIFKEKIAHLEVEIAKLDEELEAKRFEEIARTEMAATQVAAQELQLQRQKQAHQQELETYRREIEDLSGKLKEQHGTWDTERADFLETINELESKVKSGDDEIAHLKEETAGLKQHALEEQKAWAVEKEQLTNESRKIGHDSEDAKDSHVKSIERHRKELLDKQSEVERLEREKNKLNDKISELNATLDSATKEQERLKVELAYAVNERAASHKAWEEERARWRELWDQERSIWEKRLAEVAEWEQRLAVERGELLEQVKQAEGKLLGELVTANNLISEPDGASAGEVKPAKTEKARMNPFLADRLFGEAGETSKLVFLKWAGIILAVAVSVLTLVYLFTHP